jgi:hypothetical protein
MYALRRYRHAPQAIPDGAGHRGRQVHLNRNVVNGTEPIVKLTGQLPVEAPLASEATYGGAGRWNCWRTTGSTRTTSPRSHIVHGKLP